MKINIYLIRHGKTKENEEKRYVGITDTPLSDTGREKIAKNKENGIYPADPDIIFVSPMKRCMETAEIIYPGREKVYVYDFKEINFGLFEGKNYQELNGDKRYQEWIDSNGKAPFPEGESLEGFSERIMKGFEFLKDYCRDFYTNSQDSDERIVAVVAHGGTVMAIKSSVEGGEYFDHMIDNGMFSRVEICI
ncbi:histidine phosphatase family protein [Eubacterium ruminantium]|uniref:histidine phosphatase family protein n=1 Tax=Eubacterium ruminantium TaxID=42322 RepID=UPI002478730A|nr:histidine phosphatase family protein [Eubacterium ruminantium]